MKNTTGIRVHFDNNKIGKKRHVGSSMSTREIRRALARTNYETEKEYFKILLSEQKEV